MRAREKLSLQINLPDEDGSLGPYTLSEPGGFLIGDRPVFNRVAYSAAHVVANPLARHDPWIDSAIDWDATLT